VFNSKEINFTTNGLCIIIGLENTTQPRGIVTTMHNQAMGETPRMDVCSECKGKGIMNYEVLEIRENLPCRTCKGTKVQSRGEVRQVS
jgi:DnaJ-class molecular chaperone